MTIPTIYNLQSIFFDDSSARQFLIDNNVFYSSIDCPNCNNPMRLYINNEQYRCGKRSCRKAISLRKDTFFAKSRLSCYKILHFGYLWLLKTSSDSIITQLGMSSATVSNMRSYFSHLVSDSLNIMDFKIGGEGIIVEVDETKLGKRKNNRGHPVEGIWILGGVERTIERKVFLVPIVSRDRNTLMQILAEHILPGSIVYSDLWRGYINMENILPVQHQTINHSLFFCDPITGVHTNTIEGTWNGLKLVIPPRNRVSNGIEELLFEFIWRRANNQNLWNSLVEAMRIVQYID